MADSGYYIVATQNEYGYKDFRVFQSQGDAYTYLGDKKNHKLTCFMVVGHVTDFALVEPSITMAPVSRFGFEELEKRGMNEVVD